MNEVTHVFFYFRVSLYLDIAERSLKFMIKSCVIKNWQKIEERKLRAQSSIDVHLDVIIWGFYSA